MPSKRRRRIQKFEGKHCTRTCSTEHNVLVAKHYAQIIGLSERHFYKAFLTMGLTLKSSKIDFQREE